MSDKEIARDIIVAMIGQTGHYYADKAFAEQIANSYEIIYNKIHNLDNIANSRTYENIDNTGEKIEII